MSEVETFHDVVEEEIHFKEDAPIVESSTPPTLITSRDMEVIIEGWETKFEQISRCLREVQLASEKASSEMFSMTRDGRAREKYQERRIEAMHVGIAEFLERCDPAQLRATSTHQLRVLRTRRPRRQGYRPDNVRISTSNHLLSARTSRLNLRAARIRASEIAMTVGTRAPGITTTLGTRVPGITTTLGTCAPRITTTPGTRAPGITMTLWTRASEITTTLEICATTTIHDARDRGRVLRSNERPTHDDDRGDSGDMQRNSYHSGMSTSMLRPSSSPKVPTFDGTVSAQFRPWIIQFEAIACHQCWTLGERVVRLVSSLTGPAANLVIGMTMGQLDDYNFLLARLSRRYDPPEREEAHRAELRARTRRRNESADEFAENLKNLAQRAYTSADQNMLDNLVVERFREGHGNEELKKHLCLCPSTGLQDLIGACVRFETHVEIGSRAHKSNEGLYTVQGSNQTELTLDEVTRAARKLGFTLRPWIDRQQNNRGFNNAAPSRNQNRGEQQQSPKFNQNGNSGARQQNPNRRQTPLGEIKCWTCGKTGHYASDCKSSGPKFAFAPKSIKMNFLQEIADQDTL